MGREGNENYTRVMALLMEGGTFIAREILKRETQKKEGDLNDFLRDHEEQLKRRFTKEQMNEILSCVGGAHIKDWNIVLLTGVLLEVFRTTLTPQEKRELLVIRNVREELLAHVEGVSLDEDTFEDLKDQLEEALENLSLGLDSALVVTCQNFITRYMDGPIHMPSTLEYLHEICQTDDKFDNVVQRLMEETKSVVYDIMDIVRKAEDDGREMKDPKVIEFIIQPHSRNKNLLECVETTLDEVTEHFSCEEEVKNEYNEVKKALEKIFEEVRTICKVFATYNKGKGVVFRIECTSYRILLDILDYLESLQCLERLAVVEGVLRKHFGTEYRLSLTCNFGEENMKNVYEALKTENIEYSRTIRLHVQANSLQGLVDMWDMFEKGEAQNHFNEIAEALSEYVGSKVSITASIDMPKFKEALQEAIKQTSPGTETKSGSQEALDDTGANCGQHASSVSSEEIAINIDRATVPRGGGVEIIAVQPGTRKTMLFDEILSEGERDEISEMGLDIRDDRISSRAITSSLTDESEIVSDYERDLNTQETKLEEPNLDGYKNVEGCEKQEELVVTSNSITDTVREVSLTANKSYVLQNVRREEVHDTEPATADHFYSNVVFMISRFGEMSDRAQNIPYLDSTLSESSNDRRPFSQGESFSPAFKDDLVTKSKKELDFSVLVSTVLDKVGLNREVYDLKQERIQISETIMNQMAKLSDRHVSVIHFGSEAEGTFFNFEHSNLDTMVILDEYPVIQNTFSLEQPSTVRNIILAEDTRHGFMHLPLTDEMYRDISTESSLICSVECLNKRSRTTAEEKKVQCGFGAAVVLALKMSAWPIGLKRTLQQRAKTWAFDISSEHLLKKPLLMVPYESTDYLDENMEWRISTACVERALMNSLNSSQRKVFFLFHTIVTKLLNPNISGFLTSYMIKNIFFHMVSNTWPNLWNDATLIICLIGCLNKTCQFLHANFLPNFFIAKENLIEGVLKPDERRRAREILLEICSNPFESISGISQVNVGNIFKRNAELSEKETQIYKEENITSFLSFHYEACVQISAYKDFLLEWIVQRSSDVLSAVKNHYKILSFLETQVSSIEHVKDSLVANVAYKYISTSLASHLVCLALKSDNKNTRDWYLCAATSYFQRGMNSDALSSRMKFVTCLIALNLLSSAKKMMLEIEISDKMSSKSICSCINSHTSDISNHQMFRKGKAMEHVCSCITFLPTESLTTPLAMRNEMYMSATASFRTNETVLSKLRKRKWGVVDAKVYFGFLNTVLYSTIEDTEVYLGAPDIHHKETLLNILGLWSEFNGDYTNAFVYYEQSLCHNSVQNASQWYICLLLFKQWLNV